MPHADPEKNLPRRVLIRVGASLVALALASGTVSARSAPDSSGYDVLIRNGMVLDGTGTPAKVEDVAIRGDRIVLVGRAPAGATARQVIDAKGDYVTPGFIDTHSHAAPGIETAALAAAKPILLQGITAVAINPDGGGPADLTPQLARIERAVPGVNVIPQIGHGAVREAVLGLENRAPTPAEQERMQALVDRAMQAGAFGLSSGPFYVPGKYSKTDEIVGLARAAARYPGAYYDSHIRDESNYDIGVVAAVEEVIAIARAARIPGIVDHIKVLGPEVWGKSAEVIGVIDRARAEGLSIWADQYPYEASGTSIEASLVPGWAQEGGNAALAKRLADPATRARIRQEMARNLVRRGGAHALMISSFTADPAYDGKRLDDIARSRGQEPLDTAIDILIRGDAGATSFNMDEKDIVAFMKQPWTMTCTDGGLVPFGEGYTHPRAYGTFPRKIRKYVLDEHVVTMAQAIRSMTGLAAQVYAIPERGVLKPGYYADVVVFDPKTIRDVATYERPHAYSQGVRYVFVNGRAAVADGQVTAERYGRILRRPSRAPLHSPSL